MRRKEATNTRKIKEQIKEKRVILPTIDSWDVLARPFGTNGTRSLPPVLYVAIKHDGAFLHRSEAIPCRPPSTWETLTKAPLQGYASSLILGYVLIGMTE